MRQTECGVHMDEQGRRELGQVTKLSGTVTYRRPLDSLRSGDERGSLSRTPGNADAPRAALHRHAKAHFFSEVSARLEECSTADGRRGEIMVEGECVSCGLALEVPPEPTDAGVSETLS